MQGMKFNQQGIEGILAGRKTMTRRPIKNADETTCISFQLSSSRANKYAKYKIGETVQAVTWIDLSDSCRDCKKGDGMWANSEKLKITDIEVERLQDIKSLDISREGVSIECAPNDGRHPREIILDRFSKVWNNLPYQPPYDWNSNPYVFVYEFEVIS